MSGSDFIVVSRHNGFLQFLWERGWCPPDTPVVEHASVEQIRGKHVIGNLPLWMAALAETITEIPLDVPPEFRGKELTVETMHRFAGEPVTYKVQRKSW